MLTGELPREADASRGSPVFIGKKDGQNVEKGPKKETEKTGWVDGAVAGICLDSPGDMASCGSQDGSTHPAGTVSMVS